MYSVLLVDDEPRAIEALELFVDWEAAGFKIIGSCEHGQEALERIVADQPDVVFTDLRMPVMDGFELIAGVTAAALSQPVHFVVLSGYSEFEYAVRAMQFGVKDFLLKPVMAEEAWDVLMKVKGMLDQERKEREAYRIKPEDQLGYALLRLVQGDEIKPDEEEWQMLQSLSCSWGSWYYVRILADEADHEQIRSDVEDIISSLAGYVYWLADGEGSIGMIYGIMDSNHEDVTRVVESVYEAANGDGRMAVVALGEPVSDLLLIGHACATAEAALNGNYFGTGTGPVYYRELAAEQAISYPVDLIPLVQPLLEAIEAMDLDRALVLHEERLADMRSKRISPEWVRLFATYLIYQCMSLIKELNGMPAALITPLELRHMQEEKLPLHEAMNKVKEIMLRAVDILQPLHERRRSSGSALYEMRQYIQAHYRHNLTVRDIAKRFYMNPVYAGQAFQKKFGMSMLDLMHSLRIEEAKRLVQQTDSSLSAIAEQVGYSHYNHFLKQFEKWTDRKPAEYKSAFGA